MNDERSERRQRARNSDIEVSFDRLPPHAPEAEAGVLGCCLLDANCVQAAAERFGGKVVFFDVRHQTIWFTLVGMQGNEEGIDVVTVAQRLRDHNHLEGAGGYEYLNRLPEQVPSAANLPTYVELVWEKYLARLLLQTNAAVSAAVMEGNGISEELLGRMGRMREEFDAEAARGSGVAPKFLVRPEMFAEEAWGFLFRDPAKGEPGLELPIPMKLRIRRKETTLVSADDGAGKSTLLSYFALHLVQQDPGCCIASFEEAPAMSLWRLASQLIGRKHLPDTDSGRGEAARALSWLNQRFWFYNFLGISDWRDVLDTFRYAAEKHGVWLFIIDSVMRIGIADDDYAQQGFAAAAFSEFAMKHNAHLVFVIHENKSDSKGKGKVRGSKLWTANAHNVTSVERNVEKGEKYDKLSAKLWSEEASKEPNQAEIKEIKQELQLARMDWDTRFILRKQRLMGSQQNGSRRFWYDGGSAQFRTHWQDEAQNWLLKWGTSVPAIGGGETT